MSSNGTARNFKDSGRIVIVGASLAGLRAAEALRKEGFRGHLTLIGDEPYQPYDRPPLSKQVLMGWVPVEHTALPRLQELGEVEWRLGVPASGLDLKNRQVKLADGQNVGFDRLLIATGTRARRWPKGSEADLDGVFELRDCKDAQQLRARLAARPRRVLVIGAGFTGSEIASVCRELDLPVTVTERGSAPLVGALGGVVGEIAKDMQLQHGVDLRCGVTVDALEGDTKGRVRQARLSDGSLLDVDIVVPALGALRNTDWLAGSGLAAGVRGVACDAGCRAFDLNGIVTDDIFVAGDVSRFPHPLFGYQLLSLEHWGNAVTQAEVAAHNMINSESERRPHISVPSFWSIQFGVNIKSVGVPPYADQVAITQGSTKDRRFVATYGHQGRIVAAATFNQAKWLEFYREQIEDAGPFPPEPHGFDQPSIIQAVPAEFPDPSIPTQAPTIALTGHEPSEQRATLVSAIHNI